MDDKTRKIALRMFTYGAYVITSKSNRGICASTVTWVTQASFEPPLITVCIKAKSETFEIVKDSKKFILHILSAEQKDFAGSFFKFTEHENQNINGNSFKLIDGMPILDSPPVYITCEVININEIGDHPLFLAKVIDVKVREKTDPLELRKTGWSYGG